MGRVIERVILLIMLSFLNSCRALCAEVTNKDVQHTP